MRRFIIISLTIFNDTKYIGEKFLNANDLLKRWISSNNRNCISKFAICISGVCNRLVYFLFVAWEGNVVPWNVKRNVCNSAHVNLTNWRQFLMRLSCYWSWISSPRCQSSCGSPSGSADYFDNVMTKFIVNNRTDALTDITLFFMLTDCRISRSCSLTRRTNYNFMCLSAYWP